MVLPFRTRVLFRPNLEDCFLNMLEEDGEFILAQQLLISAAAKIRQ
jgi:hypothetical protein